MAPISRRDVLYGLSGTLASPLLLSRADAEVTPDIVKFRPEMEPLVALIERTPREQCAEMVVEQLRSGVSYRQVLAALFLAHGAPVHCVQDQRGSLLQVPGRAD
jgi:hypothetical protein